MCFATIIEIISMRPPQRMCLNVTKMLPLASEPDRVVDGEGNEVVEAIWRLVELETPVDELLSVELDITDSTGTSVGKTVPETASLGAFDRSTGLFGEK